MTVDDVFEEGNYSTPDIEMHKFYRYLTAIAENMTAPHEAESAVVIRNIRDALQGAFDARQSQPRT